MNKRIFKRVAAVIMSVSLLSGNVLTVKAEELLNLDDSAGELAVESEESILLDDTGDAALKIEDEAVSVSETDNETVQPESLITQDDLAADTDDDDIVINGDSVESVVEEAEEYAGSADIDLTDNANTWDGVTTEKSYEQGQIRYVFTLKKTWRNGYNASVRIYNNGSEVVDNWALCMDYPVYITNIWNATIEDDSDGKYTIKNASWNADIKPGRSVEYGFSVKGDFTGLPESFSMLGIKSAADEQGYTVEYFVDNEWKTGFVGRIVITNVSDEQIEDWTLSFCYDREITSIWNASIESHEGNRYVIKNKSYNANIMPGETASFGFKGKGGTLDDKPIDYIVESMSYKTKEFSNADIDFDNDGLMNDEEERLGTDPTCPDTDADRLSDYDEEKVYGTDPLKWDTDDDKISDYDELCYNMNPCVAEILSSNGTITILCNKENEGSKIKVDLELCIKPEQVSSFKMKKIKSTDAFLNADIDGYLGEGSAYDFILDGNFEKAVLTFTFDIDLLSDPTFEPAIYYFNEENQCLEEVENTTWEEASISVELDHFSKYILIDRTRYEKLWTYELEIAGDESIRTGMDVVFVIESSQSMSWKDENYTRKTVTNELIDKLTSNDRAAIVAFSTSSYTYCDFTNNKTTLHNAVEEIENGAGTYVNSGMLTALGLFNKLKDNDNKMKYIILFTSGDGIYTDRFTTEACATGVIVYTVGLGNNVKDDRLKEIAEKTGGAYYHIIEANKLNDVFEGKQEVTDMYKDTDCDGIGDYYEKAMSRGQLFSGTGVCFNNMDYENPDSDGDTIPDGEEVKISKGKHLFVYMYSNPTKEDTDGDGVNDAKDPWKLVNDSFDNLDNYITAENWGATRFDNTDPNLVLVNDPEVYYDTVVIHHTVRNQYESIKSLEKNETRDGFNGIPYHFVINGHGEIYEGRPIEYMGAHVKRNNTGKIGISLMGNFEPAANGIKERIKGALPTSPTDSQYSAMKELLRVIQTQYGYDYIGGHRDFFVEENTTVCPGDTLYNMLKHDGLVVLPNK
ncbi:MAG: cellulose binding domain-containing protein [Lachnospiraceae bacterium]|nr:cellulose binding domain-containing protein [Lachnospiraceae bacterium]